MVWTFLPTPLARDRDCARSIPALTIYYCIDDLASSSPRRAEIANERSRRCSSRADLVFVTSERLRAAGGAVHRARPPVSRSRVNLGEFEKIARRRATRLPADLAALPRPIAGYVGGLHQWVDQDLLAAVADATARRDVRAGRAGADRRLAARGAAERAPARPARRTPSCRATSRASTSALVPYRITEYTANVYPTKLNEYLVMGIPVVATDLAEIRRFNGAHGGVLRIAGDRRSVRRCDPRRARRTAPRTSWRSASRCAVEQLGASGSKRCRRSSTAAVQRRATGERNVGAAAPAVLRRAQAAHRRDRRRRCSSSTSCCSTRRCVWWLRRAAADQREPPQPADAIVVFAGGVGESGEAGGGDQERVKQAVDLYRAGYAPRMVFSSGFVFTLREAEVMKAISPSPTACRPRRSFWSSRPANTYENVRYVREILDEPRLVVGPARELAVSHAPGAGGVEAQCA